MKPTLTPVPRKDSRHSNTQIACLVLFLLVHTVQAVSCHTVPVEKTFRDLLWVWGNPEMTTEGTHDAASRSWRSGFG